MGQFGGHTWPACCECSGGYWEAQGHRLAVSDQNVARTMRRSAQGKQGKVASVERMPRVCDFNLRDPGVFRVLDQGIELWDRSIMSAMILF
jgi:hypothetical protein